jgi:MFS family permease
VARDRDSAEPLGGQFARLWAAATTSALGSGLATIAAPLYVASHTRSPVIVSAAFGVAWLPWLLFALPGGVLVDRVDRRRLMIVIDSVRVVAVAVLATAIATGHAGIAVLYAVLFAVNTGEVIFRSASQAMIPAVVPRASLERANGWLFGGTLLMQQMVAGPLGGFLFAVAASVPFFVNAGTYAASAILIGLVTGVYRASGRSTAVASGAVTDGDAAGSGGSAAGQGAVGEAAGAPGTASVWAEAAEGFRWLMRQRVLRTMAILIGLLNVTLTAAVAVLVLLARERLGLSSVGYGLLFTCIAAGGILGSLTGDRIIGWVTATWTIRVGLLIEAGMHLTLATSRNVYLIGFALFAFGVHGSLWGIVGSSLRQRLTPPEMLGRVGSSMLFVAAGGNCVGALLGGVIAGRFGLTAPYWVAFVVAVIVSATTWRVFNRATVAEAYADPPPAHEPSSPAGAA